MPFVEKIKNLIPHKNTAPEAPAAPAVVEPVAPLATQPINNNVLLNQREALQETRFENNNVAAERAVEFQTPMLNNQNSQTLLSNQNGMLNQGTQYSVGQNDLYTAGNRSSLGLLRQEPTIIETVQKDVVIHERIHPVEKEEIQPIIYREREQLDVKQVTQLMHETEVHPTVVQQRELAAEVRETVIERSAPLPENIHTGSRQVEATTTSQVVHAPIVNEVIRKTVVEEVQPVLQRDVYQPTIIQHTQPIHEKIIEAPTIYRQVTETRELGTRGAGYESSFGQQIYGENGLVDAGMLQGRRLSQSGNQNIMYNGNQNTMLNQQRDQQLMGGRRLSQSGQSNVDELLLAEQEQQMMRERRLSQTGLTNAMLDQQILAQQEQQMMRERRLSQSGQMEQQILPTGQVLPQVSSARPNYAYLPSGSVEKRPDFVGTSSQFVAAAGTLPSSTFAHSKSLATTPGYPLYSGAQPAPAPQVYMRQ